MKWSEGIQKLQDNRAAHAAGGGAKRLARQHDSGKLTVWERLEVLLDPGSFHEINPCQSAQPGDSAIPGSSQAGSSSERSVYPGDGVVTGWGLINGRRVCVAAEDFSVIGGTLGKAHGDKICRLQDLALSMRVPVLFLFDSGGARIEEGINALNGYGEIFQRHVRASGVIPQICAILGPCSGGACYSPALCDFIFAVDGISKMFITGPSVVESVLGKRPTLDELGGAAMHSSISGCVQALYEDEHNCLQGIRTLLQYLPSHAGEWSGSRADLWRGQADPAASIDNVSPLSPADPDWQTLVPDHDRKPYDMYQVIRHLCDADTPMFEISKHFAPNIITGLARLNGRVIGIIANQPLFMGGAIDVNASDKAARFIRFCDCFSIPLLTLEDVPAFMPGTEQEQHGIIRHGAKILYAYAEATVPKITVIIRKAFGGAYIAMNSRSLGADLVYAWPIAQIAVMGADGAIGILNRRQLAESDDPAAEAARLKTIYEEQFLNPDIAESRGYIDEVILPEETRSRLISSFDVLRQKYEGIFGQLERKHGNIPL